MRAGRGAGMALAADLNGYPGPAHVLEFADLLKLSEEQRREVQTSFDWMKAQAEALGRSYVEAETALAEIFREGKADKARLTERIAAVEKIRSELRFVHLAAHLETAALMTDQQKATYSALRGYTRARATRPGRGSGSGSGSGSGEGTASSCQAGSGGAASSGCCCSGGTGGCGSSAVMSCSGDRPAN